MQTIESKAHFLSSLQDQLQHLWPNSQPFFLKFVQELLVQDRLAELDAHLAELSVEQRLRFIWEMVSDPQSQVLLTTSGGETSAWLPFYICEALGLQPQQLPPLVFVDTQVSELEGTYQQLKALDQAGFTISVVRAVKSPEEYGQLFPGWEQDDALRASMAQLLKKNPLDAFIQASPFRFWVKSLRQADTAERKQMPFVSIDRNGVMVVNICLDASKESILAWLEERGLPINANHQDLFKTTTDENGQTLQNGECGIHIDSEINSNALKEGFVLISWAAFLKERSMLEGY